MDLSSLFKTYKKSEDYEEFQTTGIRIPLKAYNAMIYDDNLLHRRLNQVSGQNQLFPVWRLLYFNINR